MSSLELILSRRVKTGRSLSLASIGEHLIATRIFIQRVRDLVRKKKEKKETIGRDISIYKDLTGDLVTAISRRVPRDAPAMRGYKLSPTSSRCHRPGIRR